MAVVLDMVTGQMPKSSAGLPLLGSSFDRFENFSCQIKLKSTRFISRSCKFNANFLETMISTRRVQSKLSGRYVLFETIISVTTMLLSVALLLYNERVFSSGTPPPLWICKLLDDGNKIKTIYSRNGHTHLINSRYIISDDDFSKRPLLRLSTKVCW